MDSLRYRLSMVLDRFQCLESHLTYSQPVDLSTVKCELDNIRIYMRQATEALKEVPHSPDIPLRDFQLNKYPKYNHVA
jgi:hypothetical protein